MNTLNPIDAQMYTEWRESILRQRAAMPPLTEDDPRWLAYADFPAWRENGYTTVDEVITRLKKIEGASRFRITNRSHLDLIFMHTAEIPDPPLPQPSWAITTETRMCANARHVQVVYDGEVTQLGEWCAKVQQVVEHDLKTGRIAERATVVRYGEQYRNGEIGWNHTLTGQDAERIGAILLKTVAAATELGAKL
ncbi:hypothetical protein HII28_02075 [Planctomonas sp. JC2975]|uniref:hypothetical protein n=1 Tax=Planctomonas sp. JC2975 TaxID=2729626 RepID=UPI001472C057|nr:hypothetical protein [Planctomonas sp. JC2975]NNC10674.1 hypothetical protein [Planctomonas sp. JC2975]